MEDQQEKRRGVSPSSQPLASPKESLRPVVASISDLSFGGGGGRPVAGEGKKPGRDPKPLAWRSDFRLDPEKPQVTVKVDAKLWSAELVRTKGEGRYSALEVQPKFLPVIVEGRLNKLSIAGGSNDSCSSIRFDLKPLLSAATSSETTFTYHSLQAFKEFVTEKVSRQFLAENLTLDFDAGYFGMEIRLGNTRGRDPREVEENLIESKRGIAIVAEVILQAFDEAQDFKLSVQNPAIPISAGHDISSLSDLRTNSSEALAAIESVDALEVTDIKLTLKSMGGNPELKEQIQRLTAQYANQKYFNERGVNLPKGILLFGPPGTGKTLSAKIFAGEIGRRFYHVKSSDILSKYYGESEQKLRNIFEHVKGPCVLFVDEIDAIGGHRDTASEPSRRVMTELLQQMDGMGSRSDIILLAATNRKEELDPAIMRAGRFDRHILVDVPDALARAEIWQIQVDKQNDGTNVEVFSTIDTTALSDISEGLVGSDIQEVVRRTQERVVYQSFQAGREIKVTTEELASEIEVYKTERDKVEAEKNSSARPFGFYK